MADLIIQVVPAVRAPLYVRRIHDPFAVPILRILVPAVEDTLIPPIPQIIDRGRPADIIPQTKILAAEMVVASVNIQPVAEYIRLSVRDVFKAGKIGIERLHIITS